MNEQDQIFENFRFNLRILRVSRDLTGKELCEGLGWVNTKRILDIEDGKRGVPKMDEVYEIAKYFKVSIDDILKKRVKVSVVFEPTVTYRNS